LRPRTKIALLVAILAALPAVAGCGGGGDSSADPQVVLDKALGSGEGTDSGVLDITLGVDSSGGQEGNLEAEVKGPFRSNGTDSLPSVDFDVTASIDSGQSNFDFDGGLTVTPDGAWIGFDGKDYQVDDTTFQAFKSAYENSASQQDGQDQGSLEQFGIDPQSWVRDLQNEGTEDLDGTEVVHVSGSADVPKLVADLDDVARQTGQSSQLDAATLKQLEDTVTDATVDVYATTGDYSLRKIEVGMKLADPRGGSGEVDLELGIGISDAGSEQSISPPADAQPLSDLLNQIPGGASALGLGSSSAPAQPANPPQVSGSAEKYYDCVAKAKSAQAVDDCASLLGG
jgi:hypothetical protein